MSLMAMNRAFKKHGAIWGAILAFTMIGGVVLTGFGANIAGRGGAPTLNAPTEVTVATVGEQKVTRADLDMRLDNALRQQQQFGGMPSLSPAERENYRLMVLNSMKNEQAMVAAAKKAGVSASDEDIKNERAKVWQQGRGGLATTLGLDAKATDADIERELVKQHLAPSLEAFKTARIPDDALRLKIYNDGLQASLKKQVNISEAEVRRSYDDIQVRHILIKVGEGGLPEGQAKAKAEKVLAEVKADPAKMAALADQYSDDGGNKDPKTGKKNGGFYDWTSAATYVPEFSKAAQDAGVGKLYPEIVKTAFGYHIIKCEGERPGKTFPKDFDKEKQKYIDQYTDKIISQKQQEAINAQLPTVTVTVTDPLLKAAQLQDDARKLIGDEKARDAKYTEALTELAKVKKDDDPNGIVPQMKASIFGAMKKTKEAIAASEEALEYGNTVEARLALAQLYLDDKNKDGALKQLQEADKLAVPNFQTQMQIGMLYDKIGDKAKADAARKKGNEMMMRMIQMQQKQQAAQTTIPVPASSPASASSPAPATPSPAASPKATTP